MKFKYTIWMIKLVNYKTLVMAIGFLWLYALLYANITDIKCNVLRGLFVFIIYLYTQLTFLIRLSHFYKNNT